MKFFKKLGNILILLLLTVVISNIGLCSAAEHHVPQGMSIQEIINQASVGDIILIYSGVYNEYVEVNKTLTIIGENPYTTILDGSSLEYSVTMKITAPDVSIANLTVRKASEPEYYGVLISNTKNVSLTNLIISENYRGLVLYNASNCMISNSSFMKNIAYAIRLNLNSNNNTFVGNNVIENPTGVSIDLSCTDNFFYHNNFINNTNHVDTVDYGTNTKWNRTYLIGGNYWSDYTGIDQKSGPNQDLPESDGIGDTPYIKGGAKDYYPLMEPWTPTPPIAKFIYNPPNPTKNEEIIFNATESYDADGNITIYNWDFGDGNQTATNSSIITHSYRDFGNYTVTLTVTDNDALTSSMTKTVTVEKKTSTLSIEIHPTTITIGETVTINGILQPPITTNITIQYRLKGETQWKNLTEATTNIQGTYSYNWTPSISEYYELTAYWEGNDTTFPATSKIVTLNVTKKSSALIISVNPTTAAVGSNIIITGKLTPQLREQDIIISYQPLPPITTWKTLATVKTDPSGVYSYNWTTTEVGIFILKASWLGDEQTSGNESYSGFIHITKASINIAISIQPQTAKVGSNITISGKITPKREYTNITIQFYTSKGSITWNITTQTDSNGNYQYVWIPSDIGTYYVKVIWPGDNLTSLGESETIKVEVVEQGGENLIWQYAIAGIIAIMILAALAHLRRKTQK